MRLGWCKMTGIYQCGGIVFPVRFIKWTRGHRTVLRGRIVLGRPVTPPNVEWWGTVSNLIKPNLPKATVLWIANRFGMFTLGTHHLIPLLLQYLNIAFDLFFSLSFKFYPFLSFWHCNSLQFTSCQTMIRCARRISHNVINDDKCYYAFTFDWWSDGMFRNDVSPYECSGPPVPKWIVPCDTGSKTKSKRKNWL